MSSDIRSLITRLNPLCRRALEEAAELCVAQTHFNVEIEHLLIKLAETPGTDLDLILRHFDVDPARVQKQLTDALKGFKRGNSRTPALSPHIPRLLEAAWVRASLDRNETAVRSGVILLALLENDVLRGLLVEAVPALLAVPAGRLAGELDPIARSSVESGLAKTAPAREVGGGVAGEALATYTVNLTAEAREGRIDPVVGRESEVRQIIDILMRRRQNNPILTGEAGVGKTAVVEGFAARVAAGDVPPALAGVEVCALDVGALQAGAGVRGEFENRLKSVIDEVKAAAVPVILFVDEAHTLIGAGGPAGQGDAANLLKPALARGELRTIAATTWGEYKKYFEKDPALTRRFQVVKIAEPDEAAATAMLRGLAAKLEAHHNVRILDEALHEAARLSARYVAGRQLPDKAVSVLDTACARVAMARSGPPPELEDVRRRAEAIDAELAALRREQEAGRDHAARLDELADERGRLDERRVQLEGRWQQELDAVNRVVDLEARLATAAPGADADRLARELDGVRLELEVLQGSDPMVPACVDGAVVASVISAWTGVPVGKMVSDEITSVLGLRERMAGRIVGQPQALDAIARRIQTSRADLAEPGKPTGVFLLVGPSGVGKTETALTLADLLYGGERAMVTINMSEYQEAHSVSGLKGAPPGYVGYGTGGVLTEAVRRTPYTVVLLDEVEKAHADVMELFYQVFDKGVLEDAEGTVVDFRNTVILLTSNLGTAAIAEACAGGRRPDAEDLLDRVRPELITHFKPALLGRLVVVPYYPLGDDQIRDIVRLKLTRVQERFWDHRRAELTYDPALVEAIAGRCTEIDSGARTIDHILTHTLLPELSVEVLDRMARGEDMGTVHVSLGADGRFTYDFETVRHGAGP